MLIYSGFQTYGKFGKKHYKRNSINSFKAKSLRNKGVILNEPIERKKLFNKLENSRVFIYKGSKEETFCMALAEAGSWNASSGTNLGCLNERVSNKKTGFVCK